MDWQRHCACLAQLLDEGARLSAVVPGVTRHGDDIGRRLAAPRRNWARLNAEQQARLGELGAGPQKAPQARKAAAKTAAPSGGKLSRRVCRPSRGTSPGKAPIPGGSHVERLPDGSEHRAGVWLANPCRRRGRLDQARLGALAELGVDWAW